MIEVNTILIGDCTHKEFTVLCEGINGNGHVEMKCRTSDPKVEGDVFFMDVSSEIDDKTGDYAPMIMDKVELGRFIEYLKGVHSQM